MASEHLWDVTEHEIPIMDVQQLCGAVMSIWTKVSEEGFPVGESMSRRQL